MAYKKKNKYGAIKTKVNGKTCDSMLEARHYNNLLLAEKQGSISELKFHPRYPIIINDIKICDVVLDFEYIQDGQKKYVDSKGVYTSESKLRHKILQALYNITVDIWTK
jgi:hypothetical protein